MFTVARRIGVGVLLLAGLLASQESAFAQFNFNPGLQGNNVVGNPGMTLSNYLALVQSQARSAAQLAPLNSVANPYTPFGGAANPYSPISDPYGGANPYNPVNSPYYTNPYNYYGNLYGGTLLGQADVMRAYGVVITSQEQARIMREQARQARLETRKKEFDLDRYFKENTPTFTEEQSKIAKSTLKRIQTNSNPYEVTNGTALNLLLTDISKFPGKKVSMEPIPISEDVLKQLNITKSAGSIGLLRDDGKFTWPLALQELLSTEQQKAVAAQTQLLVKNARNGKIDVNVLKDLRNELEHIRDVLSKKVLEIPGSQYLAALRFLNDFDEARVALERGEATTQFAFEKWATGGRSVQELADYLANRGLRFAPATYNDEAAYRAVYPAMVALDLAYNTQGSGSSSETKE